MTLNHSLVKRGRSREAPTEEEGENDEGVQKRVKTEALS